MTDEQRDDLLISMSKSINNLHEELIDTKKELRHEIRQSEERTKNELRQEFRNELRKELRESEKRTKNELRKELRKEIRESEERTKNELRKEIQELEKRQNEILKREMLGVKDLFHDTWRNSDKKIENTNRRIDELEKAVNA